ncbi:MULTISPECIES: DUF4395 domain-containing protein [Sulfurimonas]|uniref:DUF4395 domain-containing protein n=1 Tax=Sulfurimonas diazotrophicus TaxID=3131939 RepID=A0ABZ3HCI5_9BACT
MATYIDHAEIKMGQILTIGILSIALVLQDSRLLIVLSILFLLSGTVRSLSPFSLLYRWVVQPLGIMKSDYRLDNIQPHKFGQLIGALSLASVLAMLHFDYRLTAWGVVVVLITLTAVSYAGWCIGCFLYFQLNRLGFGGFFRHSPTDKKKFMGMRSGITKDEIA